MPLSPFKPIEIIQTEIHNRITPKDEEDKLHAEVRGEEFQFTISRGGEPQDVSLRVQNLVVDQGYNVQIGFRVLNYQCPTDIEDWKEDIRFLYATNYLRDSEELGNPLLSNINVSGLNPHDIEMHITVHRISQSAIWAAIRRFANVISLYHNDHFQTTKRIYETHSDIDWENDDVPMGIAAELVKVGNDWNIMQAYSYVIDYANSKTGSESEEETHPLKKE